MKNRFVYFWEEKLSTKIVEMESLSSDVAFAKHQKKITFKTRIFDIPDIMKDTLKETSIQYEVSPLGFSTLRTLLYFDIFSYPLTLPEIRTFSGIDIGSYESLEKEITIMIMHILAEISFLSTWPEWSSGALKRLRLKLGSSMY